MKFPKLLQLHVIILLWGFTPILGKLITLSSLDLVFYRLLISGLALYIFIRYKNVSLRMSASALGEVMLMGFVVGIHWFSFYEAIKVSNVSMAMIGFATITLFASIFQPILLKQKFYKGDLFYGLAIFVGLLVIVKYETYHVAGILWGMGAALSGAFFGVYNGKLIIKHPAVSITLLEFLGAIVTIIILRLVTYGNIYFPIPGSSDLIYLLILSLLCTTIAFTWSIDILKYFTPFTVIITNNLEPVYGIVFSVIIFGQSELMSIPFYIGASIILGSVFTYPVVKRKLYKS